MGKANLSMFLIKYKQMNLTPKQGNVNFFHDSIYTLNDHKWVFLLLLFITIIITILPFFLVYYFIYTSRNNYKGCISYIFLVQRCISYKNMNFVARDTKYLSWDKKVKEAVTLQSAFSPLSQHQRQITLDASNCFIETQSYSQNTPRSHHTQTFMNHFNTS